MYFSYHFKKPLLGLRAESLREYLHENEIISQKPF